MNDTLKPKLFWIEPSIHILEITETALQPGVGTDGGSTRGDPNGTHYVDCSLS